MKFLFGPEQRAMLTKVRLSNLVDKHLTKWKASAVGVIAALAIAVAGLSLAGQDPSPSVPGFANDPTGDGIVGPEPVVHDINRIRAYSGLSEPVSSEESLQISLRFSAPIALNGSGNLEELTGYIVIDTDRNPATGNPNVFYNTNCPNPVNLGWERRIDLFSDASDGDVDIESDPGVVVGAAPITLIESLSTLMIDLPLSLLGSTDPVTLVAAVGTLSSVTDCAADGVLLTSVDRRTFNGRDEYENDDTPLRANYAGSAYQGPPFINMSALQFRTFDSPADEEWFFSTSVGGSISFEMSPEIPDDPGFHPIIEFYDGQILSDPTAVPIATVGACNQIGTVAFVWAHAFMRIRNCPEPGNPFVGTYRLEAIGFSQIDPPGAKVAGTVTEQGSGDPVPFVYIISNFNAATFSAPDTGFYQMQADGTMTLEIIDDVFTAAAQTITAPPSGTVELNFVVTRVEAVFANGFE